MADFRVVGLVFFGTACALQHVAPKEIGVTPGEMTGGNKTCRILSEVPVYVLNLDRRADRLSAISSTLGARSPWLREQACRVSAPDGKEFAGKVPSPDVIASDAFEAALRNAPSELLTSGTVASTIGHARVWEHVAQQSFPWAIIFEDDVNWLHPGLDDFLCSFEERLGDDKWKLVNLQPCEPGHPWGEEALQLVKGHTWCMGMYILSKEAAQEAVKGTFPINQNFQVLDSKVAAQRAGWWDYEFNTIPRAALQPGRATDSDVGLEVVDHDGGVIRNCTALEPEKMILPALLQPTLLR